MDERIATAEKKKVLVDIVRLSQKRGMKGDKGDWKEFLNSYDKKIGANLSDPARRTNDVLLAFLNTFTKEDDFKFFNQVIQCDKNRSYADQFQKRFPDNESPEQRLVRLTFEHPHYTSDYSFPSYDEGWVVTKFSTRSRVIRSNSMVAIDCEMVLCEDGTDAVVRMCMVDRDLQVKINEYVKPCKKVVDYRTEITGITSRDLDDVSCSLADIQKSILKLLPKGTILVGHSLNNDLEVLKLDYGRVIDTSFIFKFGNTTSFQRPSLSSLCKSILGYELREKGATHNCVDDAKAAMKLVLAKIERKIDDAVPLIINVPDFDSKKLFLHRIPPSVPAEMLTNVIPGDFTIELKTSINGGGKLYSAFAIFKNVEDAAQAFQDVEGDEEQDSIGRPQKLISFEVNAGEKKSLYVRKMTSHKTISKTIDMQVTESLDGSRKKQKTSQILEEITIDSNECCEHLKEMEALKLQLQQIQSTQSCEHLKEIESLKQDLKMKEYEITTLHNAIDSLRKDRNIKRS